MQRLDYFNDFLLSEKGYSRFGIRNKISGAAVRRRVESAIKILIDFHPRITDYIDIDKYPLAPYGYYKALQDQVFKDRGEWLFAIRTFPRVKFDS